MKYVKADPSEIDEALSLAKAPFVRYHDEAKMLLLVAKDKNEDWDTRNLCGILGVMMVRDTLERAFGFLQAVWYYEGHNKRRAVEVACHILSVDLDELRVYA